MLCARASHTESHLPAMGLRTAALRRLRYLELPPWDQIAVVARVMCRDDAELQGLKKLCTSQGKLFSRKRSGNCAAFQRAVATALKRARFMALLPYVGE